MPTPTQALSIDGLEAVYDALAQAIDQAGPDRGDHERNRGAGRQAGPSGPATNSSGYGRRFPGPVGGGYDRSGGGGRVGRRHHGTGPPRARAVAERRPAAGPTGRRSSRGGGRSP